MSLIQGKTISLTAANMTPAGSGYIISIEDMLALAFDGAFNVPLVAVGGPTAVATILIQHASDSGATVSLSSGRDALTTPEPTHSLAIIGNNDFVIGAGPYRRTEAPAAEHYVVVTGPPPTGDQLRVTIGAGGG